jgi:hypothetical protein
MRGKLLLLSSLWLAAAGAIFSIPGCYGENCNGGVVNYGASPGEGHMIDQDHWESNSREEAWLDYPRQRGYIFDVAAWGGREPSSEIPFLSATKRQSDPGSNFVIGSGNVALMFDERPNGVDIRNDTCSDYFLRLYVTLPPLAPTASAPPAPAPTDAGL